MKHGYHRLTFVPHIADGLSSRHYAARQNSLSKAETKPLHSPTAEAASYLYAVFSRLYCNWFSLDSYPELA